MKKINWQLKNIPSKNGVYIFKNKSSQILYVGKANNLKARVNSYFQKSVLLSPQKQVMAEKIKQIEHIVCNSETEALLLESNLIKKFKPPYNITLKDDKQYKYVKITYPEDFPKIKTTRKVLNDGAMYFGPFTDSYAVKQTLKLLQKYFPYRDCNKNIFRDTKEEMKSQTCLKFHIKRCLGPCIGAVSKEKYNEIIRQCVLFLQGKQQEILSSLKRDMIKAAENKNFERAKELRDQMWGLEKIIAKQKIISQKPVSQDYVSLIRYKNKSCINLFIIRQGKLIGKENFILKHPKEVDDIEVLTSFIKQYYLKVLDFPQEIILQNKINIKPAQFISLFKKSQKTKKDLKIKFFIPKKGIKLNFIKMGQENAKAYLHQKKLKEDVKLIRALKELSQKINLKTSPLHIECFDISNIQGSLGTGSMVVFEKGLPKKESYRLFKIKTIKKANDVGMIKEVIKRRFSKKNIEKWPLPNLVIVDGGKSQLNALVSTLNNLKIKIPTAALAKKEEEIFLPKKTNSVRLPKNSESLYLIQRIRDEAHRFAIKYHKNLRTKEGLKSIFDEIPGIGPKGKKDLMEKFGSIKNIQKAGLKELEKVVNAKLAKRIKSYLSK